MAQSTILATGLTRATSTDIVVAAGAVVTVGLFVAAGLSVQPGSRAILWIDTPGGDNKETELDHIKKQTVAERALHGARGARRSPGHVRRVPRNLMTSPVTQTLTSPK